MSNQGGISGVELILGIAAAAGAVWLWRNPQIVLQVLHEIEQKNAPPVRQPKRRRRAKQLGKGNLERGK